MQPVTDRVHPVTDRVQPGRDQVQPGPRARVEVRRLVRAGSQEHSLAVDDWTARYTRFAGYGVYATFFACVFAGAFVRGDQSFNLLITSTVAGSIALYCALDSRLHGKVFVRAYWFATLAAWPIAPLALFWRSRGTPGVGHYFKHLGLLLLVVIAAFALATILRLPFVEDPLQLDG